MCLAVPGRVCEVYQEAGLRVAAVEFGGVRRRVCIETLPEVETGSWVLVHALIKRPMARYAAPIATSPA